MNIRVAAQEKMANTEVRDKDWAYKRLSKRMDSLLYLKNI
jgi:hypothetical protein